MHPDDPPHPPRLRIARNRDAFLLGSTWSHSPSFPWRVTHFYLGFWVLSVVTGISDLLKAGDPS